MTRTNNRDFDPNNKNLRNHGIKSVLWQEGVDANA
jgi:hypothetical protein